MAEPAEVRAPDGADARDAEAEHAEPRAAGEGAPAGAPGEDGQPAEPAPARKKKKKKRAKSPAEPAIPGDGTPEGLALREALRAFDAGDYALVRERVRALTGAEDPAVRDAAADLRARVSVDPVQVVVILACALVLATIAYVWVF